jgi:glycosyltransferase involved in cell wall biosynthesis
MISSNPLRVLHILPSMQGYGAERQIMQLLPHLQSPEIVAGLLTVYAPSEEQRCGAEFPITDAARHGRRDFTFIGRLVEKICSFRPDIVHTHTHVGKYWGRFAAVAAGVRSIVHTEHNPCDPRRSVLDRLADRVLNPYTERCITFFPEQCQMLVRTDGVDPRKIAIIPNGLPFDSFPHLDKQAARRLLDIPSDRCAIILVGRMEYQKNHELALRALAALPAGERSRIMLFFAGSGLLEIELRTLAQTLNVAEHVRFLGYRSDVPELLAASDVLLMTSHFEGMPLALLEGMHVGAPIVTTPWLGAQSMLGAGAYGRIATGWQPADVARAIVQAASEKAATCAMAERAREYVVTEFSLSRMAAAHRQLYFELGMRASAAA